MTLDSPYAHRSVLLGLLAKLDPTHPVGIRSPKAKRGAAGTKSFGVPCYDFYCEMKAKYPRHMILAQV